MEDEDVLTEDDTNRSEQGDEEQPEQILKEDYYKSNHYRASMRESFRVPWSRAYHRNGPDSPVRAGQSGLETIRAIAANPNNALDLLQQYHNSFYSEDERERCEIIEYVPPLAFLLSEEGSSGELRPLISSHLVPLITKALDDENSQVVNMAESALLSLLKHCLISSSYIERKVWPAIESRITKRQNVDGNIVNVVSLVSKMAPWVGRELSERLIVPFLEKLSEEPDLCVRKTCASLYRDLCSVVTTEVSETRLVPSFLKLCCDQEWVVRQTCADVFMSVSCKVTLATRKTLLAPAFAKLLVDKVRWVQLSAFQALGPFITTFAEPSITSLGYNHNGELVLKHQGESFEYKCVLNYIGSAVGGGDHDEQEPPPLIEVKKCEDVETKFNSWQFWREPLPVIELDFDTDELPPQEISNSEEDDIANAYDIDPTESDMSRSACNEEFVSSIIKEFHSFKPFKFTVSKELNCSSDSSAEESESPDQPGVPSPLPPSESQSIVPQELIDHFVSMSNPKSECAIDLTTHCAYNLPAVALTLGRDNWDLLKPAYETLAADNQWKVRRIVASSIHELAVIVGEDVATQDLVPIFNGFIKDLDEVRIGALKHLAHFLKLLRPTGRESFLPRLTEFLMTDYDWNWRFRQELAEQLLQSLGLFTPADTCHHLGPVIMDLLLDKVAAVRKVALILVTELVSHVSIDINLLRSLLAELAEQFAHSSKWNRRQTFALLCSRLVKEQVLSEEMFARDVLPHLLDLSWDPVPNVRLAVARAAAQNILPNPYFADESSPHHEVLISVLKRLQADKDRDVRFFAMFQPSSSNTETQEDIK